MTIREEFEKAFRHYQFETYPKGTIIRPKAAAYWAAKWMAERCSKELAEPLPFNTVRTMQEKLLRLAKELGE